jgi:DNA repair protein RecO (recombination protein O)
MSTPLRERLYSTDAIILSRRDLGEADRLLTIFTPRHGKLTVIAKGSRRTKSRSAPHTDVLQLTRLDLAKGRDLDVVTSAQSIVSHQRFRTDLEAYGAASYMAELVRNLTEEDQEQRQVFDLLKSSLALLDQGIDAWLMMRHFELSLLDALGYRPELYRCVGCGEEIQAVTNAWSPAMGGVLCASCAAQDRAAVPMSVNAQKYVRTMHRSGPAPLVRISLGERERGEIETALVNYLRYVSERDLSSPRVIASMRRATAQG